MTEQLTDKQIEEYRAAFTVLDKDNDGAISTKDLAALMRAFGQEPADTHVHDMINEVDIDGNGSIDFSEFMRMMGRKMRLADLDDELRIIFQVFDVNQTGILAVKDLQHVLHLLNEKLSDDDIADLIRSCDVDQDGKINFQEFVHMMNVPS